MDELYCETIQEAAAYMGIDVPILLKMWATGRFPVNPRAKDPQPVWFKADLDAWDRAGRPVAGLNNLRAEPRPGL